MTRTGMGTASYMAPEVAAGREDQIGPRTDVFALGGILCAILTGHPPYDRVDFVDSDGVKQAAREGNLAPAIRRLDAVRELPALVAFAKRCLSPDPADRPADAAEVARELEHLSNSAPRRFTRVRSLAVLLGIGVMAACVLVVLFVRDRPPTPDELLTAGPWARFIHGRIWSNEQKKAIEIDFRLRKLPERKYGPLHDEAGFAIMPFDVGAYPLVKFHQPEWVETVTLSHNARLARPKPTESDYHHTLAPIPAALLSVSLPTEPGWATATTGDRLFKKLLTIGVAFTNGQYVFPPVFAGGGLIVATESSQFELLSQESTVTGLHETMRGAGGRAYVAVETIRQQWEEATTVKLQVKLRNRPTIYEYDLHPRKLFWEKGIRDGEVD